MPELPEVETIKKDLNKVLAEKEILGVETDSPKQVQPSLAVVKKAIIGATIQKIERRAKLLQIFLDNGKILVVHLKLTGRLLVRKVGVPKDEWQHAVFKLSDGWELRFCDLRKFGWIKLVEDEKELEKLLAKFGPEPFVIPRQARDSSGQALLTLEKFKEILSKWGRPIKILLMDQEKIAGVGNIYANEALFLAGVAPHKRANSLSLKEQSRLYETLEQVLKEGIKYRGASDQAYLDAFGQKGHYQEHFRVYGQAGKPCLNNCGGVIRRMTLGGRGTFFCPECQK